MTMTLEQKVDLLLKEVNEIKGIVSKRFSWEEKATESGIQIAGGPTTITHYGELLGFTSVNTPQGIAFAFVLQDESNKKFAILSPDLIKPA
jgi:hypothetical protein